MEKKKGKINGKGKGREGKEKKMGRRERMTRAGGIRARDVRTQCEENSEGKGKRVGTNRGANRGGGRGRSATRAAFARGEREKKRSCVGADHGGRPHVSDKPLGAGRNSDPVRVRVSRRISFWSEHSNV
jgi:hypothetical protein